jgi:hypothetical protein
MRRAQNRGILGSTACLARNLMDTPVAPADNGGRVEVNGRKIWTKVLGNGPKTIVVIPLSATRTTVRRFWSSRRSHHRSLPPDPPGA